MLEAQETYDNLSGATTGLQKLAWLTAGVLLYVYQVYKCVFRKDPYAVEADSNSAAAAPCGAKNDSFTP